MTHPLARFCARTREERQTGMAPRPATAFHISKNAGLGLSPGTYAIAVERWSIDGLLPIDRLSFLGVNTITGALIDEDTTERLLMEALVTEPRLAAQEPDAVKRVDAAITERLLPALEAKWEDFQEATAADHYDRVETQRALISEHKHRRRRDAEQRIRDLRLSGGDGRMRIALLEQGKLNKFLARMDVKLEEITERERRLTFDSPILAGLALITVGGR